MSHENDLTYFLELNIQQSSNAFRVFWVCVFVSVNAIKYLGRSDCRHHLKVIIKSKDEAPLL